MCAQYHGRGLAPYGLVEASPLVPCSNPRRTRVSCCVRQKMDLLHSGVRVQSGSVNEGLTREGEGEGHFLR
eukprot:1853509-Pleurochrysis_carterae.AAC.2